MNDSHSFYEACWLAASFVFIGHLFRAIRWGLMLPEGSLQNRFSLLFSISIGYAVNFYTPYHIFGEIFKVVSLSLSSKISPLVVASSVLIERLIDVLCVCLVLIFYIKFLDIDANKIQILLFGIATASSATLVLIILCYKNSFIRRLIWTVLSIFGTTIQFRIIECIWVLFSTLESALKNYKFYMYTSLMWGSYLISYKFLAEAIGYKTIESIFSIFLIPISSQDLTAKHGRFEEFALTIFSLAPVFPVIFYGLVKLKFPVIAIISMNLQKKITGQIADGRYPKFEFEHHHDYKNYIRSYFKNNNTLMELFNTVILYKYRILKFYNGGSEAVIALLQDGDNIFIRKFAISEAAKKLKSQSDWLKMNSNTSVANFVKVIKTESTENYFSYDMRYIAGATDFYLYIHSSSRNNYSNVFGRVLSDLYEYHQANDRGVASNHEIQQYLEQKAVLNAKFVLGEIRKTFPGNTLIINNKKFQISNFEILMDQKWLTEQVISKNVAMIHGDTTIENIIVNSSLDLSFFFIDPNPDNIFNSPKIDFAKLMQSLHLGYEILHEDNQVRIGSNSIEANIFQTAQYQELFSQLKLFILEKFGETGLREVYFHELINYLRLTPYKFIKDKEIGFKFFACTCILLDRYLAARKTL